MGKMIREQREAKGIKDRIRIRATNKTGINRMPWRGNKLIKISECNNKIKIKRKQRSMIIRES